MRLRRHENLFEVLDSELRIMRLCVGEDMKFFCKYCGIEWDLKTFDAIQDVQATQCYVTLKGVNHHLKVRWPRGEVDE